MTREEIELLPSGLVTCIINGKEVRILKISPIGLKIRLVEEINKIKSLVISFYKFKEYVYREIIITDYEIINEQKEEFYYTYEFSINSDEYFKNVRNSFIDYSRYVMTKNFGYENEFSKQMVGYPAELDDYYYSYYKEQKRDWMSEVGSQQILEENLRSVELALKIDNYELYNLYLQNDFEDFIHQYYKKNFLPPSYLGNKKVTRIYIGNEFCHNLFPNRSLLKKLLVKANSENLKITLCFTYMRDCYIEEIKNILINIYNWCKENSIEIEIVINDWGMINLLEEKHDYFKISLGVLLNKRKKDPRYKYKNGYRQNQELISENSLNSKIFNKFLKEKKIERYEYENCGYKIHIAPGKHSMQMPFYVTNTSQYCTLYAMCTKLDRGNQKLVMGCTMYCKDYIFAYPKHLKMVGRYNSLFTFDNTLLKETGELQYYIDNGIDRIVLNFI